MVSMHHAVPRSHLFWRRLGMVTVGVVLGISLGFALQVAGDELGVAPVSLDLGQGLGLGLVLTFAIVLAL